MSDENVGDHILDMAKNFSLIMQGEMEKLSKANGSPEGVIDAPTASKVVAALTFVVAHMAMEVGSGKRQYINLLENTWGFIKSQKSRMKDFDEVEKQVEEVINKAKGNT